MIGAPLEEQQTLGVIGVVWLARREIGGAQPEAPSPIMDELAGLDGARFYALPPIEHAIDEVGDGRFHR
jgi:hypothetical protein